MVNIKGKRTFFDISSYPELRLKTNKTKSESIKVLYLDPIRVMNKYSSYANQTTQHTLEEGDLRKYLRTSDEYLGYKNVRMKKRIALSQDKAEAVEYLDNGKKLEDSVQVNAYAFDYDMLNLNIEIEKIDFTDEPFE
jgi:hypothetical protein